MLRIYNLESKKLKREKTRVPKLKMFAISTVDKLFTLHADLHKVPHKSSKFYCGRRSFNAEKKKMAEDKGVMFLFLIISCVYLLKTVGAICNNDKECCPESEKPNNTCSPLVCCSFL